MNRIGIHDIIAARPELHEAEFLLQEHNDDAQQQPYDATRHSDEHAFVHEDFLDQTVVCAHGLQDFRILLFIDHQHGQRANHIEGCQDQNESKDDIDGPFFRAHHPV